MKKAFILVGASGSGKSTVRKCIEEHLNEGVDTFSLDSCRLFFYFLTMESFPAEVAESLYASAFDFCNANQKEFDEYVTQRWTKILTESQHVIVDNTNLTRKSRARWINDLKQRGFEVTIIQVETPLDVIIARQSTRGDKSVPEDVVRSQYMRLEEALIGSECDKLIILNGTKQVEIQDVL
jgi:tRNA uridine 5-carbamoylmethylation protein Kti12